MAKSTYLKLEQRIAADERGGIDHRWQYGRELLAARTGRQRLPKGFIGDRIAEAERAGLQVVSPREIQRRIKFAETYPTEVHKRQALS
ncbi:MAG: hypothetical protein M3N43_13460, partial [Actinomycetota bacterium]|nr:hypothetical protein [Actinomycetota bacterium]